MKEGDVVLTPIPQADGRIKNRPALILCEMPPFNDYLVCGISTQLRQYVKDFDELIVSNDEDFDSSGLISDSLIRLGFLAIIPRKKVMGAIGAVSTERHNKLMNRLSGYFSRGK